MPWDKHQVRRYAGLDLGQVQDFSAFVLLERQAVTGAVYKCKSLHRWPLGTGYPEIVKQVCKELDKPDFAGTVLVVDQTGVGRGVVDLFRQHGPVHGVTITAGSEVHFDEAKLEWKIAKKELVAAVQSLLQTRRLLLPQGNPLARTLTEELKTFRVKITAAANETFEAWRERDHDDLVLSVALAAFLGEIAREHGQEEKVTGRVRVPE